MTPDPYFLRKADLTGRPIADILNDELGHKVRLMFQEINAGFAMSAFNYAGEAELLSGVLRNQVLQMGQELARIQRGEFE